MNEDNIYGGAPQRVRPVPGMPSVINLFMSAINARNAIETNRQMQAQTRMQDLIHEKQSLGWLGELYPYIRKNHPLYRHYNEMYNISGVHDYYADKEREGIEREDRRLQAAENIYGKGYYGSAPATRPGGFERPPLTLRLGIFAKGR